MPHAVHAVACVENACVLYDSHAQEERWLLARMCKSAKAGCREGPGVMGWHRLLPEAVTCQEADGVLETPVGTRAGSGSLPSYHSRTGPQGSCQLPLTRH